MRILVTGSAGRIGRAVVSRLLARGDRVTGFDLKPADIAHPAYREVVGAFEDAATTKQAMAGAEAVLHLGAFMSWLPAYNAQIFDANVSGTRILLEAAVHAKVVRIILASSGEVYPEGRPRYQPIDEIHPREPLSAYGLSKLLAEELAAYHQRTHGLPLTVLRFAHTQDAAELLDPQSFFSGPRFYLRGKIRQQRMFGNARVLAVLEPLDTGEEQLLVQCAEDGTPYRMMIADTRDIADGILLALSSKRAIGATLNLGPDEPTDFESAVDCLQRATGLPVVRACLPVPPMNYVTSNAQARQLLGFAPRWTFATMVEDALADRASARR